MNRKLVKVALAAAALAVYASTDLGSVLGAWRAFSSRSVKRNIKPVV